MVMNDRGKSGVRNWIEAELAGRQEEADRQFRPVMARLQRLEPPAGFTARALQLALAALPARRRNAWTSGWMYAAVGVGLSLAAFEIASLSAPAVLGVGVGLINAIALAASTVWVWAGTGVTAAWSVWKVLARVGGAVTSTLDGPAAFAFLTTNVLIAAGSLAALRRLLISPGRVTS